MTLKEMRATLEAKRAALNAIYDEAGGAGKAMDLGKITSIDGDNSAKLHEMRQRNEEIGRLQKDAEAMAEIESARKAQAVEDAKREDANRAARDAGTPAAAAAGAKAEPINIGREIVKLARSRKGETFTTEVKDVEPGRFKANFVTTAGWPPESVRIPGLVIADAHQEPMLLDVVPSRTTGQAMVKYMEETTYTSGAAERAEAAAYPEATFALTERNYPVRVVGHRVPVSDEQLEDVEGAESYLNDRLTMGIRERLSSQILKGAGTGVLIAGLQGVSGYNTGAPYIQASADDTIIATIKRAATGVATVGFAMANLVVMHPEDWDTVRLTKTSDGQYIWGHPALVGVNTLWGIQVVQTTEQTKGTALTGDTRYCALYERRGIMVELGYTDDDFENGMRTIRAGVRVAMARYRATAFTVSTGLKA